MKPVKFFILTFLILIFASSVFSQKRNGLDEWLKLKVFVSNRQDVEKIYGEGEVNGHFVLYQTRNGVAAVYYSAGDCKSNEIPIWNVSEWNVTGISYHFRENPPKLKDLIPDKSKYKKKQAGDVSDHVDYYNEETGVSILYDKLLKEVGGIVIRPSSKDKLLYDCDLINKK